ncbi:MAG: hypothetical protein [Podoviridae sp. ctrTa16]|nr:MAG: hypothetical protein [Podoviridae sp. ctrTa16]
MQVKDEIVSSKTLIISYLQGFRQGTTPILPFTLC